MNKNSSDHYSIITQYCGIKSEKIASIQIFRFYMMNNIVN